MPLKKNRHGEARSAVAMTMRNWELHSALSASQTDAAPGRLSCGTRP